jgi:hypothetical protein
MPLPSTNLRLSEDQEAKLLQHLLATKKALEEDNSKRIERDKRSWEIYENQLEHRLGEAGIFEYANDQLPLIVMLVDTFTARAEDEVFGSDPFVRWGAEGAADYDVSQKVNRYLQWKFLRKGSLKGDLRETVLAHFIQRAVIFKAVYERVETEWLEHDVELLFDGKIGDFVEIPEFGYVVRDVAEWEASQDPETGAEYLYLAADPSVVWDDARYTWKKAEAPVEMKRTLKRGAKSATVPYDKFLCPSNAPTIDAALSTMEFYAKPLSWVSDVYLDRPWTPWRDYKEQRDNSYSDRGERTSFTPGAEDDEPPELPNREEDPEVQICEAWIKYDILGRGKPQDIVVWWDVTNEHLINYEFWAKVTPHMGRPYDATALIKTKPRWYGKSLVERLEPYQTYVDKQWNAESYRNEMAANPITGINPNAVHEKVDGNMDTHPGKRVTLKDNKTIQDFISFAVIPNVDSKTQQLIEYLTYRIQVWLGTANLAQGDNQPNTPKSTATEVEESQREKSKVSKRWIRRMADSFIDHLKKLSKLELATMDEREVFEYTEGAADQLGEITPEDVANLEVNVNISLAQSNNTREVQKSQLALDVFQRYIATPPELRPFVKPLYKRILNANGFPDAENILPDNAPVLAPETAAGGTPAGPDSATLPPNINESGAPPLGV